MRERKKVLGCVGEGKVGKFVVLTRRGSGVTCEKGTKRARAGGVEPMA